MANEKAVVKDVNNKVIEWRDWSGNITQLYGSDGISFNGSSNYLKSLVTVDLTGGDGVTTFIVIKRGSSSESHETFFYS